MLRLVFCALGNSVRNKKFLTAVIFSAVAAMLFCVNVTVGYGENMYHAMKNGNNYTALTVSDLDGNAAGTDMIPYLREKLSLDIGAALYVAGLEDGSLLVGWDGSDDVSRWFAKGDGRFFTADEISSGAHAAYIDDDEYSALPKDGKFVYVGSVKFDAVGSGGVGEYALRRAIGGAPQSVIGSSLRDRAVRIIPYRAFTELGYVPELIILRVGDATHAEVAAARKSIAAEFSRCSVYMPADNSDEMKAAEILGRAVCGLLLALIVILSMKNILGEWLDENRVVFGVFMTCGVSRARMKLIILSEIFIIFSAAMAAALAVQYAASGALSFFRADMLPTAADAALSLLAVFLLTAAVTWRRISSCARTVKTTERM